MLGRMTSELRVPDELVATHSKYFGDAGRVWLDNLPGLAADLIERWELRRDGTPICGAVALIVPVVRADGTPAMLKIQPVDDETVGEPVALRAWNGAGAVRLLEYEAESGSLLLERLGDRTLADVPSDLDALRIISELLLRLNARPAPDDVRRMVDVGAAMLDRVPVALATDANQDRRRLIRDCAAALREVLPEPGDRLLHWDLHFDNVLAGEREPWLAIDPKPLAGDPGFELLAGLHNRWDDVVATGDVPRAVRRRFDLMTEVLGLDRERAVAWTLARVLQNKLWEVESEDATFHAGFDEAVAAALR
ncbi:hydroxyurea phosphotransferase [Phytohabitans aurantiacus]|uniref:Hydroxyurea phosphotransferase n=2 Tax=Phytohabitans aurantiacus TaxID=3016789 RepID=A0ABQ5QRK3_9ACTN|nr:hydroxyurea phosphotransferase [Phytohabitans aurantiacus]